MRFKKLKDFEWFPYTVAACAAVLFWFILNKIGLIASGIGKIVHVCIPIIGGLVIAYILDPITRVIERNIHKKVKSEKLSRNLAVVLTILIILILLSVLFVTLIPQIVNSAWGVFAKMEIYKDTLFDWLDTLNFNTDSLKEGINNLFAGLNSYIPKILEWIIASYQNVSGILINVVVSLILGVYFLFGKAHICQGAAGFFKSILKESAYGTFVYYIRRCNEILTKYITGSLVEAIAVGAVNAILMTIFRMPYIVLVSVVVGITNLVPTFGPLIGGVIGFFLLFMEKPFFGIAFIIFTVAIQTVDGYIVKPKMFGETLGVSSIWILIAIIVLGKLFGIIGMVIAIPFAAIVQILLRDLVSSNAIRRQRQIKDEEVSPDPPDQENAEAVETSEPLAETTVEDTTESKEK